MLQISAGGFAPYDDPIFAALFEIVVDLHAGPAGGAVFQTKIDLSLGLIAVDCGLGDVDIHGADVERFAGVEMIHDAGANGLLFVGFGFAGGDGKKNDAQHEVAGITRRIKFFLSRRGAEGMGMEKAHLHGNGRGGECNSRMGATSLKSLFTIVRP